MNLVKLIKKRNNTFPDQIFFIKSGIEKLMKKSSDEILQEHPDESLAKPKHHRFVNRPPAFQTKEEKLPDIVGLHCLLCHLHLSSEYEVGLHKQEVNHHLRSLYRNNKKALDGKLYFIDTATVSETVKMKDGECLVRLGETVNVKIVLSNKDNTLCTVTDVTQLIPSSDIELSISMPSYIVPNGNIQFTVKANFHSIAAVVYPVVFHITKKYKKIFVLHEMIFRVQNVEIDHLGPTGPYKKVEPVKETVEYPIISGEPPPLPKRMFPNVVPLNDYPIPADVIYIINSGFVEERGMEKNVKDKLKKILGMLKKNSKGKLIPNMTIENYSEFMRFLLHMEEHQMLLDIHKYDREKQKMEQLKTNKKLCVLEVPGLAEKRPSLMKNDRVLVRINGEDSVQYEGIVHEVRETEVFLGFCTQFLNKFVDNMELSISFRINRYPLRLEHRALTLLKRHGMSSLMFPNKCSSSSNAEIRTWFNRLIESNEEQKTAVRHIVSGSFFPSPYIVFGPPGTGKTVTIVEAILQLWKNYDDVRILACTPSNAAADVLTTRLLNIPKNELLRMYADCWTGDKIPEKIKHYSNYDSDEKTFYYSLEEVLKKKVVISTLITAGRLVTAGLPGGHFTHIFIDESGHATEPELLVAVCGLLNNSSHPGELTGRLVLAGDPRQLGPILRSNDAISLGLGTSFLERLVTTNEQYKRSETGDFNTAVITKLVNNFRSHEAILKAPNELFYDNELKACGGDLTRIACTWKQLPKKNFPIIFHGVQGKDEQQEDSPSYFNRQEINVVMKYVEALFEERLSGYKVQEKDIGIITPYRLQVRKFRELLKKKWPNVTIGSVEEFQGQERLIIIISTVRANVELLEDDYKFHLGFLKNPKRFNVAVTRAIALLIVVGNPNVLQRDRSWKKLLDLCRKNGAYTGCKYQPEEDKPITDDETSGLDFAGLSLVASSNVEDGPQWRSEM